MKCHWASPPRSPVVDAFVIFLAEFLGTTMLLYMGCLGAEYRNFGVEKFPFPQTACLSWGFAIILVVQCFGHISGCHVNPAVTIAAVILDQVKLWLVPVYLVAQIIGALAGYGLVALSLPSGMKTTDHKPGLCCTVPSSNVSAMRACFIEFILTALLIFALCAVWDKRNASKSDSTGLRLGFLLTGCFMIGGSYTGASLNSARSFAPAIFNNEWKDHWVYWIGPNLAGLLVPIFYKIFFVWLANAAAFDDDDGLSTATRSMEDKQKEANLHTMEANEPRRSDASDTPRPSEDTKNQ